MKRVFTAGVFDLFHYGHVRLLSRAKALGDYLLVAVQKTESIRKYKISPVIAYGTEQRLEMVSSIRYVDEVIPYDDLDELLGNIEFDVFVRGEDQNSSGVMKIVNYCEAHNKKVVVLERTPDVSSSLLKEKIEKAFV
jgi:glycerol-3-phosphate cytidylyltransferase